MENELLRVYCAEAVKAEKLGEEIDIDIGNIRWPELEALGRPITELNCDLLGISKDSISMRHLFEMPVDGKSQISVSFAVDSINVSAHPEIIYECKKANSVFLNQVFQNGGGNGDLFDEADVKDETICRAIACANDFLAEHGGKRISSPVVVHSMGLLKSCSGKYSPKPQDPYLDPEQQTHRAKVTGLNWRTEEVELTLENNRSFNISYKRERNFEDLRSYLGDETCRNYTTQMGLLANGKRFPELVRVEG